MFFKKSSEFVAPTISHHLKELSNAELIFTEKRGKFLVARVNGNIDALVGYLGEYLVLETEAKNMGKYSNEEYKNRRCLNESTLLFHYFNYNWASMDIG